MYKNIIKTITVILCAVLLVGCTKPSNSNSNNNAVSVPSSSKSKTSAFTVTFIDVGHGDAALVECDGQCMLIDGGDTSAENAIKTTLDNKNITTLNILAVSHTHKDHIGGLPKGLSNVIKVEKAIANTTRASVDTTNEEKNAYTKLTDCLAEKGAELKPAKEGEKFNLGSAEVEVVYSRENSDNDGSLVLLVTYGDTRFLFTGDIEYDGQKTVYEKYLNDDDTPFKINVMKMPHHGSYEGSLLTFLRTFMPDYCIISDSANEYQKRTDGINLLESYKDKWPDAKVCKTYENGDIIVSSDGKKVTVTLSKGNFS